MPQRNWSLGQQEETSQYRSEEARETGKKRRRKTGEPHQVPQRKDVIIVGLRGRPQRVLARLVGRDDAHVVERRVEQLQVRHVGVGGGDLGQHVAVPGVARLLRERLALRPGGDLRVHVGAGLLRRDEGHADPRRHARRVGAVERVHDAEPRARGHVVAGGVRGQGAVGVAHAEECRVAGRGAVKVSAKVHRPLGCAVPALESAQCQPVVSPVCLLAWERISSTGAYIVIRPVALIMPIAGVSINDLDIAAEIHLLETQAAIARKDVGHIDNDVLGLVGIRKGVLVETSPLSSSQLNGDA